MDPNLISKKELLELTGISYGQLYRWKRKNLIPEDWFIRKSTFTGQETFFPREKILERIEKIQSMKDDLSLDQMADMFSPSPTELTMEKQDLIKRNIVTKVALDCFIQNVGDAAVFSFEKILYVYVLNQVLATGDITLEEGSVLLRALQENYPKFEGRACELIFLRKLGVATCCLVTSQTEVRFESGARVVARVNLANCIEELKIKLAE
jgi:DNA-binding transcriptional MerR regulator